MNTQNKLEELEKRIKAINPVIRDCSIIMVALGTAVVELSNNRNFKLIEEMEKVCVETFEQAGRVKNETITVQ